MGLRAGRPKTCPFAHLELKVCKKRPKEGTRTILSPENRNRTSPSPERGARSPFGFRWHARASAPCAFLTKDSWRLLWGFGHFLRSHWRNTLQAPWPA